MEFTDNVMVEIIGHVEIEELSGTALDQVQDFLLTAVGSENPLFIRCMDERNKRVHGYE